MENLIVSVNVVLPLFLMMALGYFLKAVRLYDDHVLNKMNNLVFKVFLPILLFVDLYSTDLESVFNPTLVLCAGGSVLAAFFLSMAYVCLTEKSNKIRGALIQGIFRSNFIIFGIPIARSIYGDNAASSAAILLASGTKGKRLMLPNARVLIHQPAIDQGFGKATEIEIQAKEMLRMREWLEETLAKHTGQDVEKIRRDIEVDTFLTAPEAKEYGIVDEVLEHRQ